MSKFFANERAALGKAASVNAEFKKDNAAFGSSPEAQTGTVLEFIPVHVRNAPVITFMAFIKSMSDNFRHDHQPEQPFGRPDPYHIWQKSERTISISWTVPSTSKESALRNLNNLNLLIASQYPAYASQGDATSIAASPLFRVKYANMISHARGDRGLLCTMSGVEVSPEVNSGFIYIDFDSVDRKLKGKSGPSKLLIPKNFSLSVNLSVVHDHSLGWDLQSGEWRGGDTIGFPYGYGLGKGTTRPAKSASPTVADAPGASEGADGKVAAAGASGMMGSQTKT
tara:strand:- start:26323 stop:27171 length:849 start_codon:yes stop_codon:yes gene_type:complete